MILLEKYQLKNPEWRFDTVPELMDGVNIADFVDPDIMKRLEELEKEEEERLAKLAMEPEVQTACFMMFTCTRMTPIW